MYNKDPGLFKFPLIYIVEASAGTGKTYALAERYIQLLIDNPLLKAKEFPINTILAITFTNKATIEMKERILELLKRTALDKSFKDIDRKKAYAIMDHIIRNYNFFQVQTIDSFINSVLSGCAFNLNLSINFKTKKDFSDELSYSLDKLIDNAASDADIAKLFHNFLMHYLFIENKTGWFPKKNILSIMEYLFLKSNKYKGTFSRSDIEPKDLILLKKALLTLLNKLKDNLPEGTNAAFVKNLSLFVERSKETFDIDGVSNFLKRESLAVNKGYAVPADIEKLFKKIKDKLAQLCELESLSAFNYYVDIFNRLGLCLKEVSSEDDVLFLPALNKEAHGLFSEDAFSLPELYCRLATRFEHFLIDEFQDTSRLQWENLFIMIEEALSKGGSLFLVGDRKQAIYRFRGGEVSLIDSLKCRFRGFNLIEDNLSINYRSREKIVEFNNLMFSEENLRRFLAQKEALKKGAVSFDSNDIDEVVAVFKDSKQSWQENKQGGYVRIYSTEEVSKGDIIGLLEDLKNRFSLGDIAFLTRTNDEVELLTQWLLEEDIPVESEKTLNIRQNPLIKELTSFLNFLNSPIDNLSFASFILGDIFLKVSCLDSKKAHDFIFKLRDKEDTYLYREFRQQFPAIWENLIEEFFKNVGFVPLYELVISVLERFKVFENFYQYQGFFMKFLEVIREQEQDRPDISSFLEYFSRMPDEDLYVTANNTGSVKIYTIHKAKGLGFGVVIVPFLEMNIKPDSAVVVENNGSLGLVRVKKRYADFSGRLKGIAKQEYKKAFIDELNTVYVAFTRAIDELYIFVSPKAENSFNMPSLLLPDKNLELGKKYLTMECEAKRSLPEGDDGVRSEAKPPRRGRWSAKPARRAGEASPKGTRDETIEIPPSRYKDWIGLLKDEFIEEGILQARQKIVKGKVLHCILSFIGNLYKCDKEAMLKQAIEKTAVQFPSMHNLNEEQAVINRLLENPALKPFFEVKDGQVYLEKELVNSYGDTKRIDRLIVTAKEALIIDYKSTKEKHLQDLYHRQVGEYMKIISEIYPSLRVRGILLYLDSLTTEEIHE